MQAVLNRDLNTETAVGSLPDDLVWFRTELEKEEIIDLQLHDDWATKSRVFGEDHSRAIEAHDALLEALQP